MPRSDLAPVISLPPDRKKISSNQGFRIRLAGIRREFQKFVAYPDGHGIVQLVNVLSFFLVYRHMGSNQFTEIIQCHPCPYFLDNGIRFFTMEGRQTDCIFEFAKRSFLPPALIVKGFEN